MKMRSLSAKFFALRAAVIEAFRTLEFTAGKVRAYRINGLDAEAERVQERLDGRMCHYRRVYLGRR